MFNLMIKDLRFNIFHHIIAIIVSVTSVCILSFDTENYSILGAYISILCCFMYLVGKSCLLDDSGSSINWLKSLSVKITDIVHSKFILTLIAFIEGLLLFFVGNGILSLLGKSFKIDIQILALILGLHLIYCGLYLFLFFGFSYSATQFSFILMFVLMAFTKMIGSKKFFDINNLSIKTISITSLAIGVLVYIFSWLVSIHIFIKRS